MRIPLLVAAMLSVSTASIRASELPLAIDKDHSQIEAEMTIPLDTVTGKLTAYDAPITVDPTTGRVITAQLHFHFVDFKTDNEHRDRAIQAWENSEQFPEAVYTLNSLDPLGNGKWAARGLFIFHGISRNLAFPVSIAASADHRSFTIDGETTVDTRDHGLPVIRRYGILKADPVVKVRFHLQGTAETRPSGIQ